MRSTEIHALPQAAPEEQAYLAQLAALNAAFEAARAGRGGAGFAQRALAVDEVLERFIAEIGQREAEHLG